MRVLLIKAPYKDVYGPIKLAAGNYFLLGLGYIASFLIQNGYSASILDPEAQGLSSDALINKAREYNPDIIGISATTPDFANALKIASSLRQNLKSFIVLGGIHGSSLPEHIMERYSDKFNAVCIGEGEVTMLELCQFLDGKIKSLDEIKGLCFIRDDKITRTLPRPFIEDLDSLPLPARDLVDLSLYRPHAFNFRKGKTATIITSRGCPFRCIFCASKLTLGGKFRARSPESVLSEIRHLVKDYGVNHILIQDDTFTFDVGRAKAICRKIIEENIKIEWFAFSQVTKVDEELFRLMKEAGCYCVGFGIESADQGVLKEMRKANTVEQCEFAVKMAKKCGLKTQGYFIFGNKGDTVDTVNKTISFALRVSPTLAFFNKLVPYPGTEIFKEHYAGSLDGVEWRDFVPYGVHAVSTSQGLDKRDLQLMALRANLLFYFRPVQIIAIMKTIKSLQEFKEYCKAGLALVLQMISWKKDKKIKC